MGGDTNIQQPATPTAPSVTSSISDYVQNYPALFALQQQYAPQEAAQQVALAQQYAGQLGQAYKSAQEAMYPGETAINNALNTQVQEGMQSDVPQWMKDEYKSNVNANLGSNAGSGMGADYVSTGLLQQKKDWQDYYRNLGLSITGRQPIAQANTPTTNNVLSGYTPQSVMNYNSGNYGNYSGAYSSMYGTNANNSLNSMWSNIIGGAVGGAGAYFGSSRRYKKNIKLWA